MIQVWRGELFNLNHKLVIVTDFFRREIDAEEAVSILLIQQRIQEDINEIKYIPYIVWDSIEEKKGLR